MTRLSRKEVLEKTDNGKKLFQLLLPDLNVVDGKCKGNLDSTLSKGRKTLSVFVNNRTGLYYFKDYYTGVKGDIFEYVARLHKLDSRTDFKQVLEIISKLLDDNVVDIDYAGVEAYRNNGNETELTLANKHNSDVFINNNYLPGLPFLEYLPKYEMRLVESCSFINERNERRFYTFDYSVPKEAFYSLTIEKGQFYILFNPYTRKCHLWGNPEEFYTIGQEIALSLAYSKNVYLSDTIVLTNSILGLLFLQDKGIPSIAVLNGETDLPEFFQNKILPQFPNRYYLSDMGPKSNEQMQSFTSGYGFEFIRTNESYLVSFLKNNQHPEDIIMERFEVCEGYEYEGRHSNIDALF